MLRRRGFLGGLAALAAPAIIRTPGLLMPVRALVLAGPLPMTRPVSSILTINQITCEAVRLWKNSNAFLQYMDKDYPDIFAPGPLTSSTLRLRLPA
jgi:hypothetical protein